jgi:hypothetical protein
MLARVTGAEAAVASSTPVYLHDFSLVFRCFSNDDTQTLAGSLFMFSSSEAKKARSFFFSLSLSHASWTQGSHV